MAATIVVAEDDHELRAVYSQCLRLAGHAVLEACHGGEAVRLVRDRRPDLLLLDLWLPVLNGLQVLDAIRHDPAASRTKVVMLSAQSDADSRLEAFGEGADEYLIKGAPLADLLDRVRRCLASADRRANETS